MHLPTSPHTHHPCITYTTDPTDIHSPILSIFSQFFKFDLMNYILSTLEYGVSPICCGHLNQVITVESEYLTYICQVGQKQTPNK